MAPSHDDDFDWLYGQQRRTSEPEPTRVLPAVEAAGGPSTPSDPGPETQAYPPPTGYPPPGWQARASQQPAGPPGRPPGPPPPPVRPPVRQPAAPRPKRSRARTVFAVLGIALAVILVWLLAVPLYAWTQIRRVDDVPTGDRPADQPGTTFLLVGSDSRDGLSKAERKRLGTGNSAGQRTDTIMILSIPPGGRPALISVPRDSYVAIPGNGENKINAAYAFGGPSLLVRTVEQNTGLRIDAYTEIGFGGFVNVIDSLGGIEMCLPKAIKDADSHIDLPKGCQTLNGTDALGYVRMRKADARGDLGRVERQREMLSAVAKEAASPMTVVNPVRYWRLATSSADALAIGQDTGILETIAMANAMRKIGGDQGLTLTVPVADTDASTPAGSAVLWDEEQAEAMFDEIARGDTSNLEKYAK